MLLPMTSGKYVCVRRGSLGRLRHAAALDALGELLGHGIANLRKEAALALGELGQARALPVLQAAETG